jgi:CubicO group peptidase (beta-lactamase class C family)
MRWRNLLLPALPILANVLTCTPYSRAQETPDRTAAVEEVFADLAKPGSPGCAVAVAHNSKMILAKGYGLASIEENVRITPDSVFDIGSTSKQFTAASILLLGKEGKLSINDDIRKYIPELPDYGKKITILNLLNHTSGLRDYLTLFDLAGVNIDDVTTDQDALALITRQKGLNFDPGSEWLYSNTGFFLLSVVVKRVSGQSLRDFAAVNIFQPLGMSHTQYRDTHTLLIPNRAQAYDPVEKGSGYTLDISYFEQTGDGAVHTTVGDLLKWDENFYTAQVGGKALLAELQQPGALNSGKALTYAKGLAVGQYRGLHTVSHGGSWGGYRAQLLRFPEQHFSVVCLCNRSDGDPEKRAEQVADLYLSSVLKEKRAKTEDPKEGKHPPEISVPAPELEKFAGNYQSAELAVVYRLVVSEDKLKIGGILLPGGIPRSSDFQGKSLTPLGKDQFELAGSSTQFQFQRDSAGQPTGFILNAGRTTGILFVRASTGP